MLRGAQHNAGQHLCNAVRQEDCLPRGSPSLAADRHQHRRQERAKEQGQISKREANDATNFQTIIHFKEWRRFTLCVLMYSAAGRRGNPMPDNLSLLWFRVNKKKHLNNFRQQCNFLHKTIYFSTSKEQMLTEQDSLNKQYCIKNGDCSP